jgi:hypothetical protein
MAFKASESFSSLMKHKYISVNLKRIMEQHVGNTCILLHSCYFQILIEYTKLFIDNTKENDTFLTEANNA